MSDINSDFLDGKLDTPAQTTVKVNVKGRGKRDPKSISSDNVKDAIKAGSAPMAKSVGQHILNSMPDAAILVGDMGGVVDVASDAVGDIRKAVDASTPTIKRATKYILPKMKKHLPTALYNRLEEYSKLDPKYKPPSKTELEQDRVLALMNSMFQKQLSLDAEEISHSVVKAKIDDATDTVRHSQHMDVLHGIQDRLIYQNRFIGNTQQAWMRKILELKYMSLFTAKEQLNVLKVQTESLNLKLDAIVTNTGLPDVQKKLTSEHILFGTRNKMLASAGNSLTSMAMRFKENVKRQSGQLSMIPGMLDMGISGAEAMSASGQNVKSSLFGAVGGEVAGNVFGDRLADRVAPLTSKIGGFAQDMHSKVQSGSAELRDKLLESSIPALRALGESLPVHQTNTNITNELLAGGNSPTPFDIATRQSIVEIIPKWLSIIAKNTRDIFIGAETEEQTYDPISRGITSISKARSAIEDRLFGNEDIRSSGLLESIGAVKGATEVKIEMDNDSYEVAREDVFTYFNNLVTYGYLINPKDIETLSKSENDKVFTSGKIARVLKGVKNPRAMYEYLYTITHNNDGSIDRLTTRHINNGISKEIRHTAAKDGLGVFIEVFGKYDMFNEDIESGQFSGDNFAKRRADFDKDRLGDEVDLNASMYKRSRVNDLRYSDDINNAKEKIKGAFKKDGVINDRYNDVSDNLKATRESLANNDWKRSVNHILESIDINDFNIRNVMRPFKDDVDKAELLKYITDRIAIIRAKTKSTSETIKSKAGDTDWKRYVDAMSTRADGLKNVSVESVSKLFNNVDKTEVGIYLSDKYTKSKEYVTDKTKTFEESIDNARMKMSERDWKSMVDILVDKAKVINFDKIIEHLPNVDREALIKYVGDKFDSTRESGAKIASTVTESTKKRLSEPSVKSQSVDEFHDTFKEYMTDYNEGTMLLLDAIFTIGGQTMPNSEDGGNVTGGRSFKDKVLRTISAGGSGLSKFYKTSYAMHGKFAKSVFSKENLSRAGGVLGSVAGGSKDILQSLISSGGGVIGELIGMTGGVHKKGFETLGKAFDAIKQKRSGERLFFDVYLSGDVNPGSPLLTAKQQKTSAVLRDGASLKRTTDITMPVIDSESGDVLISTEDIEKGLVDVYGTPIGDAKGATTGSGLGEKLGKIFGGAGSMLKGGIDSYFGFYKDMAEMGAGGIGKVMERLSAKGREKKFEPITTRLDQMIDLINIQIDIMRKEFSEDDVEEGSYEERADDFDTTDADFDIMGSKGGIGKLVSGVKSLNGGKDVKGGKVGNLLEVAANAKSLAKGVKSGKLLSAAKGLKGAKGIKGLGALAKIAPMVARLGPAMAGIMSAAGPALAAIGPALAIAGPALAVAGAGVAGYKAGQWLDKKLGISDKLGENKAVQFLMKTPAQHLRERKQKKRASAQDERLGGVITKKLDELNISGDQRDKIESLIAEGKSSDASDILMKTKEFQQFSKDKKAERERSEDLKGLETNDAGELGMWREDPDTGEKEWVSEVDALKIKAKQRNRENNTVDENLVREKAGGGLRGEIAVEKHRINQKRDVMQKAGVDKLIYRMGKPYKVDEQGNLVELNKETGLPVATAQVKSLTGNRDKNIAKQRASVQKQVAIQEDVKRQETKKAVDDKMQNAILKALLAMNENMLLVAGNTNTLQDIKTGLKDNLAEATKPSVIAPINNQQAVASVPTGIIHAKKSRSMSSV